MGRFTKRLILGLTAALALAAGAVADSVLDDFEGGTNRNKFGGYWYFYTNLTASAADANPTGCDEKTFTPDISAGKVEIISNAEKDKTQLKFKGGYGESFTEPKEGSYSGVMQFGNVEAPWNSQYNGNSWPDVYPAVGMGTQLTRDTLNGVGAKFTATAIKFWMKVNAKVTSVGFKVETADQLPIYNSKWDDPPTTNPNGSKGCPADAAYQVYLEDLDELSTSWKQYTVKLTGGKGSGDLSRAAWETWKPYTFDVKRATKIAWFVEGDKSAVETGGLIAVDNIEIVGYDYEDPEVCFSCVKDAASAPPSDAVLFTDFDKLAKDDNISVNQNVLGGYWYAYTDVEGRKGVGTASTIDAGQWDDPYYPDGPSLEVTGQKLGYGQTDGAFIQFTMGTPYEDANKNTVQPFVGLGTDLDTNDWKYYDASSVTQIWFRYRTSGFDELYVEVYDEYADTTDDAEVFFIKIPGTSGEWKVAQVPLNILRLPEWAENRPGATLDKTKLKKIQFKNQSTKSGSIQIDDVYLSGATVGVKLVGSKAKAAGSALRAAYSRGKIGVNWNNGASIASGKIQLVNTKGRVVASAPIAKTAGKVTASFGAGSIPTGMYFVRVNAKDVNGRAIVSQTSVSVVK